MAEHPGSDAAAILWRPIGNGVADHTNLRKRRLGALDADIDVGGLVAVLNVVPVRLRG